MEFDKSKEYWSKTFKDLDVAGTIISATEFDACTFEKCDFSDVEFNHCNFIDCEFIHCNLSNVTLNYSKFSEVCFRDSKLIGVDWTKVAWSTFIFSSPVKFYKSILNDSTFYGLTLQDLVIEECKAHSVDFREGDFSGSNFSYSELSGCLFANTNLSKTDFTEATEYDIDISQNTIVKAKFTRFEAIRLLYSLEIELVD